MIRIASLFGGLIWSSATAAQSPVPHIWPVRGLYGLERSTCDGSGTDETDSAMVSRELCGGLGSDARQIIGQRFVEAMTRSFPNVETTFAAHLPADATTRAKLAGSLIASLRLSRATIWRIDKKAGSDAFLPITLTLDITNAATGEVLFTRTRSQIFQGTYAASEIAGALAAQFPAKLEAAMNALVADAAMAWRPWSQAATVVGRSGGDWIVDHGRAAGFHTGDALGADGHIVYAGANYALVHPVLEKYAAGQIVSRTAASPVETLALPSALIVMEDVPPGYAAAYLTETFEDALGSHAGFAPMPINPGFSNLRAMALGAASATSIDGRSLPDYVLAVRIILLPSVRIPSNIPGVSIERHEARAFVTVVDRSGRAVFTVQGISRIVDQVSGETRFSADQRHDTAIRNSLIDAATKLAAFHPEPLTLPITGESSAPRIADAGGALPIGAQLTVLRDIGSIKGVSGHVLVPVGEVRVSEVFQGGVSAENADAASLKLGSNDVVAVERAGPPLLARSTVVQCTDANGVELVDDRGSIRSSIGEWTIAASFIARYPAPVLVSGLPERLAAFAPDFTGWDQFAPARKGESTTCFIPVIAVTPTDPSARDGAYRLTAGVTLMHGSTKVVGHGMQAGLTPTALPKGTPLEISTAFLQQDLADQLPALADRAAASFPAPM